MHSTQKQAKGANCSTAMEQKTISKNRASLKSLMSKENQIMSVEGADVK